MTIPSVKYAAEKVSKRKTQRIGKRSISDILNDKPILLTFDEKINYIRHHFTYYEGNYDLFNDSKGKPNKRKALLNKVISDVVLKRKDPSILKKFNRKILIWRKDAIEKQQRLQIEEKAKKLSQLELCDWYNVTKINNDENTKHWRSVIVDFINSPENNLEPNLLEHIRYKRLKEIVNEWSMKKGMFLDYNLMLLSKYSKEELTYKPKEIEHV